MNIYLDNPAADLDLVILITMSANPNVCTVPLRVNITENYLSLKIKKSKRMMTTSPIQYFVSLLCRNFINSIITW